MSEKARVKEFTNLYSMGLLPKIEGRYLTGPKPTPKLRLSKDKRSQFSMEKARKRLNMELKRIELSQRIMERSERSITNRSLCRTEPIEPVSPLARLNTIHIKSIDIATPKRLDHTHLKKPHSLVKPPPPVKLFPLETFAHSLQVPKFEPDQNSQSPSVLKAKFGKKSIEEQQQEAQIPPSGGVTIGQWASSIQADRTLNHFQQYSEERFQNERIIEKWSEQNGLSHQHIAIRKIQKEKREFLFKSTQFLEKE